MNQKGRLEYFGRDLEAMSCAANYHRWICDEIRPYLSGRIAEVGAGTGSFTDFLLELPLEYIDSYEPSVNMYPLLCSRHGDNSRVTTLNTTLSDTLGENNRKYDAIVYINVLEHIDDDMHELKVAMQALKPGGHIVIFVPALPFLYSSLDRDLGHFRRYRYGGLSQMLVGAGYHVKKCMYFDILGIVPWFLLYKLLGSKMVASQVSAYDTLVVPIGRMLESIVKPPVGKNLLSVAQKSM